MKFIFITMQSILIWIITFLVIILILFSLLNEEKNMILKSFKKILNSFYISIFSIISYIKIIWIILFEKEIKLEMGGGNRKGKNGWINIDITRKCDLVWNLKYGIPFPDKSVDKIYSSHFLEHLTFKEIQKHLIECLRVLDDHGKLLLCVPNARLYILAYLGARLLNNQFFGYKTAYNNTTNIDFINYIAYMDGHHKYMFDEENLIFILENVGFRNVKLREFIFNLDDEKRRFESFYIEAEK